MAGTQKLRWSPVPQSMLSVGSGCLKTVGSVASEGGSSAYACGANEKLTVAASVARWRQQGGHLCRDAGIRGLFSLGRSARALPSHVLCRSNAFLLAEEGGGQATDV
jgi:hypothetical protein